MCEPAEAARREARDTMWRDVEGVREYLRHILHHGMDCNDAMDRFVVRTMCLVIISELDARARDNPPPPETER